MLLLGVDVETTGLDPGKDEIIEVAAVLWCTLRRSPLSCYSAFIQRDEPLTDEIKKITGIDDDMLKPPHAKTVGEVFHDIERLSCQANCYVAHNAEFDRGFLESSARRNEQPWIQLPWVDTLHDIPYPDGIGTRKLSYLAAEHGFIPMLAHRAMFDVLTMLKILDKYPLPEILAISQSPMVEIIGQQKFEENDKVKAKAFRWDGERKKWVKKMKKCFFEIEQANYDFPFKVVE